ncbi:hypothetical protein IDM40_23205 [Nocardiopsis sp. HNM0947]|uniref:Uncharacterized protein n=1 Tax=Nocardiopsis coralli TaxID=2772213 RepID=A0ABR9PCN3_9ACTN|nr:hypothetical protein [Nocardiopsis coralli]MBE3001577.1 hypothetical protein [Nocardiopsis coralli]
MSALLYRRLFDDAALFPPGNAPLGQALPDHRAHRAGPRDEHVGPFLVSDARVAELRALLSREEDAHGPLETVVTVPGGAPGVPTALAAADDPRLRLAGVEVAAAPGGVGEVAGALERHLPPGASAYVELSREGEVDADLAELAGSGFHAKFRTGGVSAAAHPGEEELARFLHAAVGAAVAFKCTAGLHHAVRHTSAEGFEQHGFLNVLLATAALLDGATAGEAAEVLARREGHALAREAARLGDTGSERLRTAFHSFGTCSVTEPLEDLVVLGLLPAPATRP